MLALAKGATPGSGGRERPHSRGRLRHQPVLPQCPYYRSFRTVYIDTIVLVIYAFYQFNDLRQKAPWAGCWLYQAVPISGPGGRLHRIDTFTFKTSISGKFSTGKSNAQMGRQISHKICLAEKNGFSGNFCSWIENPGNVCFWNPESCALESGIQLKESGIPLTIRIWKPRSTDKESGIQYLID